MTSKFYLVYTYDYVDVKKNLLLPIITWLTLYIVVLHISMEREEEEDIVTNSLIFFTRHTQGYSGLKLALDSVGSLCRCSRRSILLVMCA